MSTRRDTEKWSNQMERIVDDMREREAEDRLHPTTGSASGFCREIVTDRMNGNLRQCGNAGTIPAPAGALCKYHARKLGRLPNDQGQAIRPEGDAIEDQPENTTMENDSANQTPAKEPTLAGSPELPCWAALWLCNRCGHEFAEIEAAGEEVSPDCDEMVIACPKCHANNLDEEGSLTHPDDRLPNADVEARRD